MYQKTIADIAIFVLLNSLKNNLLHIIITFLVKSYAYIKIKISSDNFSINSF